MTYSTHVFRNLKTRQLLGGNFSKLQLISSINITCALMKLCHIVARTMPYRFVGAELYQTLFAGEDVLFLSCATFVYYVRVSVQRF